MEGNLSHRANQPNLPNEFADLLENIEDMSAVELAEAMEQVLATMTDETYNEAIIDVFMDELERKAPMPEMPDSSVAYVNFQQVLRETLLEAPLPALPSPGKRPIRLHRLLRAGLAAAIAILCALGGLMTVQAAGIDVFGAMARWTEEIFSFGIIRDEGAVDTFLPNANGEPVQDNPQIHVVDELEYATLQEALNAYDIAEVCAPTWMPDGYIMSELYVMNSQGAGGFILDASYTGEEGLLGIEIMNLASGPSALIEKTDDLVKQFEGNGTTFYLITNTNNYTIAWQTEHYECYFFGPNEEELLTMVYSMFN